VDLERAHLGIDLVGSGQVDLGELLEDFVALRDVALVELVVRLDRRARDAVELHEARLERSRCDLLAVEGERRHSPPSCRLAGSRGSITPRTAMTRAVRALITGGTGRLGSAIAAALDERGWNVVAAGRTEGDVARPREARALVKRSVERLGGL